MLAEYSVSPLLVSNVNQCEYKTITQGCLNRHKRSVHELVNDLSDEKKDKAVAQGFLQIGSIKCHICGKTFTKKAASVYT